MNKKLNRGFPFYIKICTSLELFTIKHCEKTLKNERQYIEYIVYMTN